MVKKYVPDRGDICWASLDPTLGREQWGRRPILVLSSMKYNLLSGLALVCPLTSKIKNYPYEVRVAEKGVVLSDHIRSIAWKERDFQYITKIHPEIFLDVLEKIKTLLDL